MLKRIGRNCAAIWIGLALAVPLSVPSAEAAGTTIVKAVAGDPEVMDPRFAFQARAEEVVAQMYDELMQYETRLDPATGQLIADEQKPTGKLVDKWEGSADGLTWTFHIKDDAVFHSGNSVTAADVKWSFERADQAIAPGGNDFDLNVISLVDPAKNVEVIDEKTFRFTIQKPVPYVLNVMTNTGLMIFDSKLIKEEAGAQDPWGLEYLKTHEAGSGPFMLDKFEPGVQVSMKRFDKYHSGPSKIENLIFRVVPSAANRTLLLKGGEVQFAEGIPLDTIKDFQGSGDLAVLSFPSTNQVWLNMNTTLGPFAQDPKVRQAVACAIPYQDIVNNVYFGFAQPGGGPLPTGNPYHDDTVVQCATDLAKAKQLMAESKSPNGFDVTLTIDSSQAEWEGIALIIQNALKPLGINVAIDKLAPANYNEQFFTSKLPFFLFQGFGWVNDPSYYLFLFWEEGSYGNRVNYANDAVKTGIADAKFERDQAKRQALYSAVQKQIMADVPAAWLAQPSYVIATQKNVKGIVARIDQLTRFYTMSLE